MSDEPTDDAEHDFDEETLTRIRERTLKEEKKQLHKRKTHNIIPKLEKIIREEVSE